ncbi:hypothetical protein [Nocardia sp. NPDC127526]|uniref:hypothetical protein n=1 Tax=Nocardia sp. NPDC127526 TaxID=3345393 RepID=UPI003627EFAA
MPPQQSYPPPYTPPPPGPAPPQGPQCRPAVAPDPVEQARRQLALIEEFLTGADLRTVQRARDRVLEDLVAAAAIVPEAALRLIPLAKRRFHVGDPVIQAVFRQWMRSPDPSAFAQAWGVAAELMKTYPGNSGASALCVWFANTLRAEDPDASAAFRNLAVSYLADLVDANFDDHAFSGGTSVVWQVLYALGPGSRSEWFRLLGDRAEKRGDAAGAKRRYELAERFGGDARRESPRHWSSGSSASAPAGPTRPKRTAPPGSDRPSRPDTPADPSPTAVPAGPADPPPPAKPAAPTPRPPVHPTPPRRPPRPPEFDPVPAWSVPGGPSEPARRGIALAVADILHGRRSEALETLPQKSAGTAVRGPALFVIALGHLQARDLPQAREALREFLGLPGHGEAEADMVANARIILGVLDADGRLLATGVGALADRYREHWATRSMMAPQAIGEAVLDRGGPPMLAELTTADARVTELLATVAGFDSLYVESARRLLAKAARAALLSRPTEVSELIAQALRLVADQPAGAVAALHEAADRIERLAARPDHSAPRALDLLAVAALRVDGVMHPWTRQAVDLWREHGGGEDPESLHHLAIAEHAQAYQLELAGDAAAFPHWRQALAHWARIYHDLEFWDRMRAHLGAVMPDCTPDEIDRAVSGVRAELPDYLLDPHVTRIRTLWRDDYTRARAHMELIRKSPFPEGCNATARRKVTREADHHIRRPARAGEIEGAISAAATWLHIDPGNLHTAEAAIDVGIDHAEQLQGTADWAAGALRILLRISATVEPLCRSADATPRTGRGSDNEHAVFAAKAARLDFWLGACLFICNSEQPGRFTTAAHPATTHLERALRLGLPPISPYDAAPEILATARQWELHTASRRRRRRDI